MGRKKTLDMTGEICALCCEGKLEARQEGEYFRQGERLVIIDNVPSWVCNKCGERYHHAQVYKKMRDIALHRDQLTEHVSIPMVRYQSEDEVVA